MGSGGDGLLMGSGGIELLMGSGGDELAIISNKYELSPLLRLNISPLLISRKYFTPLFIDNESTPLFCNIFGK